jgi:hypothetical protein
MERTPLQTLAALTLDVPDVVAWAADRRAAGATLEAVASEISAAVGSSVSRETVRLWLLPEDGAA